jgi:uncharacterized protein YjaG (DUF416 family)
MRSFDEAVLIQRLGRISKRRRIAFAAACAERLMPAYANYVSRSGWGDAAKLRFILDDLWSAIERGVSAPTDLQSTIDACMALIPGEDRGPWMPEQAYAEDAVSALAYALQCHQTGAPQEAAWSARRAYEAVDQFVVRQHKLDTEARRDEKRVLAYPAIQNELERQDRDLESLSKRIEHEPSLIRQIRERATSDARNVFG